MERKTQFHVWALPLGRLQLLMAYLISFHPASVRSTERGPTMKLPLALSMIQVQEGRTGANRAEDWSARPSPKLGIHQCLERFVADEEPGRPAVAKRIVWQGDEEGWFSGLAWTMSPLAETECEGLPAAAWPMGPLRLPD